MSWRVARSLEVLRGQVNTAYPNRSKATDGTIGNAAHARTASDHNPNTQGVVCAADLTHDPKNGFDAHGLAERLRVYRHPALKYIISNKRIAGAWTNWEWAKYKGSNPHTNHIHISVGQGADGRSTGNFDDASHWQVQGTVARKSDEEIAREVIAGKWGNGAQRQANLNAAGYLYSHIQALVNSMLATVPAPAGPVRKSENEVANEVLRGNWGNGQDRKNRLARAGYDYNVIQQLVNQRSRK